MAFKVDADEKLQLISIVSAPHMNKDDLDNLVNGYKNASRDMIELVTEDHDYSNIKKLKKALNKDG